MSTNNKDNVIDLKGRAHARSDAARPPSEKNAADDWQKFGLGDECPEGSLEESRCILKLYVRPSANSTRVKVELDMVVQICEKWGAEVSITGVMTALLKACDSLASSSGVSPMVCRASMGKYVMYAPLSAWIITNVKGPPEDESS